MADHRRACLGDYASNQPIKGLTNKNGEHFVKAGHDLALTITAQGYYPISSHTFLYNVHMSSKQDKIYYSTTYKIKAHEGKNIRAALDGKLI